MSLNTRDNRTMISQRFADQYQLNHVARKVRSVCLADSRTLAITQEATTLLVRLGELHKSFSGPIMPGLNNDVIFGPDQMRHNRPYIDWDTVVITLARNGVRFQLYPAKMYKLLKDTVFVRLTEVEGYDYHGDQVNFSQCSVEIIRGNESKQTIFPPPNLRELL